MTALAAASTATAGSFAALNALTGPLTIGLNGLATTPLIIVLPALAAGATALVAALVPLAAVVGTLVAGFGALAGAFGLVLGTGLVAFNEEIRPLTEVLADLRDELMPLIVAFGEAFTPLIADAIDAIPVLVEDVLTAVGGMEAFVEVMRGLGELAMEAIPTMAAVMVDFAETALPVFMDFVRWLDSNAMAIFDGMVRAARAVAPALMNFARAFIDALPEITALGVAVVNTLVPALTQFVRLVEDVVNLAQSEGSFVGFVESGVSRLLQWVQGPGLQMIRTVGNTLVDAFAAVLDPSGEGESGFFAALVARVSSVLNRLSTWMESGGQAQIQSFLTSLFGGMATAIDGESETFVSQIFNPLVNILAGVFRAVAGALASDEAGQLSTAFTQFTQAVGNQILAGMIDYFRSDQFASDIMLIAEAIGNTLGNSMIEYFSEGGFRGILFDALADEARPGLKALGSDFTSDLQTGQIVGQTAERLPQSGTVRVVLEEDTDVVNSRIREGAQEQLIEVERRNRRNTGGTSGLQNP
jgi:phage-related protein